MLDIQNLHVRIEDREILKGLNLNVKAGEVHAIMGPNGSGKSTLSKVLAGHSSYEVVEGTIDYEINRKKKNLLTLTADERAREGIFLAFQYPVEIPGVSNSEFLRAAFNAVCRHQGVDEMDPIDFEQFLADRIAFLGMNQEVSQRQVNVGFSGGEKKRNEILQMAVLNPRLAILDETDSGLDVDSLRQVAEGINKLRNDENKDQAIILITHYQRILNYIVPDFVHVLNDGKIVRTGDKNLALEIEKVGYESIL